MASASTDPEQTADAGRTRKAAYGVEKRRCRHHPLRDGGACIRDLIGSTENQHRYCVATQDESLREALRHVPGVPIIYFDHGMLVLEPISDVTKQQRSRVRWYKRMSPDGLSPREMTLDLWTRACVSSMGVHCLVD